MKNCTRCKRDSDGKFSISIGDKSTMICPDCQKEEVAYVMAHFGEEPKEVMAELTRQLTDF